MNELDPFTQAVQQGIQMAGPASSIPEVSKYMQADAQSGLLDTAGRGAGVIANQQAAEQEAARRAAQAAKQQEIQDQLDPSKYKKLRKEDGGYAFYDPTGKEIDIDTYAKRTGQRRIDAIAESENPVDQQFADDYSQMNDLNQAIWRNDTAAIDEYKALYPNLFSGGNPTPEQVNKLLLQKYPHMFGMGQYEVSKSNLGNPIFKESGSSGGSFVAGQGLDLGN